MTVIKSYTFTFTDYVSEYYCWVIGQEWPNEVLNWRNNIKLLNQ